jgi:cytochrome c biogenesis protein CcmG, thiol:disulfide interchange protein DsbE
MQEKAGGGGWLRSEAARPVRRRIAIAVDVLLFAAVIVLLYQRAMPQAAAALGLNAGGEPAPPFRLVSLQGDSVSLDDLRGQVVLVNFWASWCPPCRIEMPGFERVYRQRRDEGFVIVGIATDRHAEDAIRAFVAEHDITYPILLGTGEVIRAYGGINALPESFLVDREGRVRHRIIGFFAEPALRAAVSRLLADRPAAQRPS